MSLLEGTRYPEIDPDECGLLDVGDGHQLYWETAGNPAGTPAIFLHGGPGSGCSPGMRRVFDPAAYRIVMVDQRGCGRSRPLANSAELDLSSVHTQALIEDLELLRRHLGISQWVVAAVSWGVTLGLAYAQQHPQRVLAMGLAAVTAGRRLETEWITRDMGRIFPREWDEFISLVPQVRDSGNISAAYAELLTADDPAIRKAAAHAWCIWEDVHVSLAPGAEPSLQYENPDAQMLFARQVTHFWAHGCFLDNHPILDRMGIIQHIPAVLIHGRWDVSSPLDTAWELHRRWPGSRLVVLPGAGHGGPGFWDSLTGALDTFVTA